MKKFFQDLIEIFDMNQESSYYRGSAFHRVGAVLLIIAVIIMLSIAFAEFVMKLI